MRETHHEKSIFMPMYAKAALAFVGTVGTFLLAKTTGWLPGWIGRSEEETGEEKKLSLTTNVAEETHPLITSFSSNKRSLQDTLQPLNPDALPVGNEFRVNNYTINHQSNPSVSGLSDGGFVVAWSSYLQDGSEYGIYAQRYTADGVALGNEFRVNNYTINHQSNPSVSGLSDGGFVVAWTSYLQDGSKNGVYAQRYAANSTPVGNEFRVNMYITDSQMVPSVSGLTDGGFVVVWQSEVQDTSRYGVYARRYAVNGSALGNEFRVNTYTTNDQRFPSVSSLTGGGFVVAWESELQDSSAYGIYGQRYAINGSAVGSEFRINTYTNNYQLSPSVCGLTDGGFVVAWESFDGSGMGIYAQRYAANGSPIGNEFRINTYTNDTQADPSVGSLVNGGFVVAWNTQLQDGSSYGVYAQYYAANGTALGNEFRLSTYTGDIQGRSSISGLVNGEFVVAWESELQDGSGYGIYAQHVYVPSPFNSAEFQVNTYPNSFQDNPSVSGLSDGGFVVVWESYLQDGSGSGIYAQRYGVNGTRWGNEFLVNNYTTNNQRYPSVSGLSNGGFVVAWQSELQDGYGIYAQCYGANGSLLGNEFRLNNGEYPSVSGLSDGGFVVVWEGYFQEDSLYTGIYAQRYAANGTAIGNKFRVNTYTTHDQIHPSVSSLTDGGFIVAWGNNFLDSLDYGIYVQRYATNGSALGNEFQVNVYTTDRSEYSPAIISVAGLRGGGFVVVWEYELDIHARCYMANGSALGDEFRVNTHIPEHPWVPQWNPSVTGLEGGGFVVAWESGGEQDGSGYGIYAQRYAANGFPVANEFQVNTYTGNDQKNPSVSSLTAGGFVVVWDSYGIYERRFIPPTVIANQLSITEGQTLLLNLTHLNFIFPHNYRVPFQINNLQHGQFELIGSPGKVVTSFYQKWVEYGWVQFSHDGSEIAPRYEIVINDGFFVHGPYIPVIDFTFINDNAPVLIKNQLNITEGETLLLSSANLNVTDADVDQDLGALNFTIQILQHGRFEFTSQPNISISSFLQSHILNNTVRFIHDGGEIAPSYNVTVSDGIFTSSSQKALINFTPFNDSPQWVNNNISVTQGQKTLLTPDMLWAFDSDNTDAQLHFLVTNVQHGRFEKISNQGAAIFDFTQQEVKNGQIQFVHDNSEIVPSFDIALKDGEEATVPIPGIATYTNINDKPQFDDIVTLTVTEGQTVVLSSANLRASDKENDTSTLIFTVSGVTHGYFNLATQPNITITSFTQQQVQNQQVRFTHDGTSQAPSFFISVSDGSESNASGPQLATINFSLLNDLPVLTANRLTISEGNSVILTSADLAATDEEDVAGTLTFNCQNIQYGRFENINNPGVGITSFTQQSLVNGDIKFTHDGSEQAPSYDISVSDTAGGISVPQRVSVTFIPINTKPQFEGPISLTVSEAQTVKLSVADIKASDQDNDPASLIFTVSGVTHGYFNLASQPSVAITSFTQQQIQEQQVCFTHDGTSQAPSFFISVSDGNETNMGGPQAATINFNIDNDLPFLINNHLNAN